jgi:hypothetical protein
MSSIAQLKKKWMEDPDVRDAFIEMTPEFEISRGLIDARIKAGLTQEEVALPHGNYPICCCGVSRVAAVYLA